MDERKIETRWSKAAEKRITGRFLKGPILLLILQQAARLPGVALQLFLAVWHRADLCRTDTVTLPSNYLRSWGIGKDSKRRALARLESEDLLAVTRGPGKTSRVRLKRGNTSSPQGSPKI